MVVISNFRRNACALLPSRLSIGSILPNIEDPQWWFQQSEVLLQWQLVVFLSTVAAVRAILNPFKFSKFSCQLIAGLIFGCTWKRWNSTKLEFFTVESEDALGLFACFGYMLYLFIAAVKVDVTTVLRTDAKALKIGIPTFFVPLICGYLVAAVYPATGLTDKQKKLVPAMVAFHSQTAFPVIASLISELKIVNSEVGRLAISSALVNNVFSMALVIVTTSVIRLRDNPRRASFQLGGVIVLFLLVWVVFRSFMFRIVKNTPTGKTLGQSSIQGLVFFALLSCYLFSLTAVPGLLGPYVLGLAMPEAAPLASTLVNRAESFVENIFSPILVVTCGLRADVTKLTLEFFGRPYTRLNVLLFGSISLIKMITGFLCSIQCKLPLKEALTISLMITCKGVVELVFYTTMFDQNGMSERLFVYLSLGILAVATMVPIAVRFLYDSSSKYSGGYQNRDILHLNPHSELRVLTCIYEDENVYSIIHLLNLSCPTKDNPIAVYVFHLIELVGRTNSVFIAHKSPKTTMTTDEESYSENVVLSFEHYGRESNGTVQVECFTVVSPNKFMQDDICALALDNNTSLIILPFHRTWTIDGLVAQDDNKNRALNCSVLEKAPCSVGILANRGKFGNMSSVASSASLCKYSVCVVYLGGNDDREAISYAQRMAKDCRVDLTVLRLKSSQQDQQESNNWESMLNSEVLRYYQINYVEEGFATYREEVSKDGPETAFKLRKMMTDYDLIIVGRRHGLESPQTSGLDEWSEFPELGILGDLIVSADVDGRASVLVIQHQMITHL